MVKAHLTIDDPPPPNKCHQPTRVLECVGLERASRDLLLFDSIHYSRKKEQEHTKKCRIVICNLKSSPVVSKSLPDDVKPCVIRLIFAEKQARCGEVWHWSLS